ncbi:unnamed protein product [Cuscuta campestris]|uniref:Uncharacterized protein n=1 Tax=Cuscuta campestris TaxID=132261 RepID=A0A484KTR2_9ASTE|nr:unnamed protein product [Cuscuta campestris]
MARRRNDNNNTPKTSSPARNCGGSRELSYPGDGETTPPPAENKVDYPSFSSCDSCGSSSSAGGSNSLSSTGSSDFFPYRNRSSGSPYTGSPWNHNQQEKDAAADQNYLVGTLFREDGHVYSVAATGGLLYTGSESKNIRVWKNLRDYSGFKSSSGFVKAIVVWGEKIFTGHQDGKIRIWSGKNQSYKRVGSLPTTKDYLKTAINPNGYVEVRRRRKVPWLKHYDAVSCMSVDQDSCLLYSGSWDKTLKVWRLSDNKCVQSIKAHHDAVNSVVVGFDRLVFTGSADGTVKAWRREVAGGRSRNYKLVSVGTLLKQDNAVTSLAVSAESGTVYLYAGSSDGLVNFWEMEGKFMTYGGVLRGHKLAVLCLAATGSLVATGSADKSICLWRREEGGAHACMSVLTGHSGPIKCLAVEEVASGEEDGGDRRWLVYSGSLDKTVKVWSVTEHAPDY